MDAPKATRPRGRPAGTVGPYKAFLQDPDRYAIAAAEAYICLGLSERKAFDLAAVLFSGNQPEVFTQEEEREWLLRRRRRVRSSFRAFTWRVSQMVGVDGRASRYRKKARRAIEWAERRWRVHMAYATAVALSANDLEKGAVLVRAYAWPVGELAWAEAVLIPSLAARLGHRAN